MEREPQEKVSADRPRPVRGYTVEIATATRVGLDVLLLVASFSTAYWLRFHSPLEDIVPASKGIPPFSFYVKAFPVAIAVFLYMFKLLGSYAKRWRYDAMHEFFVLTRGVTAGMIALMAITFLLPSTHSETGIKYSRLTFLLVFPLVEVYLLLGRLLSNAIEKRMFRASRVKRTILVIGTGESAARLARHIHRKPHLDRRIIGFLGTEGERRSSSRFISPVLGGLDDIERVVAAGGISEIVLTAQGVPHHRLMEIVALCEKNLIDFKHVPDMFEIMTRKVDVVSLDGIPLIGIRPTPLHNPWNRFVKRCFDFSGSLAGLVVSSPVIALSAIAIKCDSKGPVFYSQERCGEDGKMFNIYKLRTMVVGAEEATGPVWARSEDPRCTRVGAFLRRYNLDELPQLFNVFRGDMSLVGPRPERPHFVRRFREDMPHYMARHKVKSGLTGWAQVNGLRGDTSVRARLRYDLYYLENWSLLFDIKVLFMTLFARKNAY